VSERDSSSVGHVITDARSRLSAGTVERNQRIELVHWNAIWFSVVYL